MNPESKATPAVQEPAKPYAGLIRWVLYSVFIAILLLPIYWHWQAVPICLLLGHFSSQLNAIANK